MTKIETDGNWQSVDKLDGETLMAGELIEVQLPDGTLATFPVKTITRTEPGSDMGRAQDIPVSHAFVEIRYHGAYAWIRIAGFMARRVK